MFDYFYSQANLYMIPFNIAIGYGELKGRCMTAGRTFKRHMPLYTHV